MDWRRQRFIQAKHSQVATFEDGIYIDINDHCNSRQSNKATHYFIQNDANYIQKFYCLGSALHYLNHDKGEN